MNHRVSAIAAGLVLAAGSLFAQEEASAPRPTAPFFRVMGFSGECMVQLPTTTSFIAASPDKMYPLGTVLRTGRKSTANIRSYNNDYRVSFGEQTEVTVAGFDPRGERLHMVLTHGTMSLDGMSDTKMGMLQIDTPSTSCLPGPKANIKLEVAREKDGLFSTLVVAERGEAQVSGLQYEVPLLKVGCGLRVLGTQDRSLTRMVATLGEFPVRIENGGDTPVEFIMKPAAAVKIMRQTVPVSGVEVVSVLAVDEAGLGRHSYSYAAGTDLPLSESTLPAAVGDPEKTEEAQAEDPFAQPNGDTTTTPDDWGAAGGDDAAEGFDDIWN